MMNDKQLAAALQINRVMQMTAQSLNLDDAQAMEIADLYPKWGYPVLYDKVGEIISYGVNSDGETQLYRVQQAHTSQENWTPDTQPSLYKPVGFIEDGTSIWTQPQGAHDAYNKGDTVSHNGKLWVSDVDGNVWEPGVYGWTEKKQDKASRTTAKAK